MDCVGHFARGGRVDGGAVYEQSLSAGGCGEDRFEDAVEDVLDVRWFGEDGDDGFLFGVSVCRLTDCLRPCDRVELWKFRGLALM